MFRACQSPPGGGECVHPADGQGRVVATGPKTNVPGFVQGGLHDGRRGAEELDAIGPLVCELAHPFPGCGRCMDRLQVIVDGGEIGICVEVRCGDFMRSRRRFLLERPGQTVEAPRLADCRDAVRKPKLVDVISRGHLAHGGVEGSADMRMAVDKARGHESTFAVDLEFGFSRSAVWLDGQTGAPTLTISMMVPLSTTISTNPQGGAPVPSISVAPRNTMRCGGQHHDPGHARR